MQLESDSNSIKTDSYFQVDLMTQPYFQTIHDGQVRNPKSMMIIRQGDFKDK